MKVVIIGGTGGTGRLAVERALAEGHEVTVIARDPMKVALSHARLTIEKGDAADLDERALAGAGAVISVVGPTAKTDAGVRERVARVLTEAMKRAAVKRLVWVSIGGAGDSREQMKKSSFVFGHIIAPIFLKKQFADAEAAERVIAASGLEWTLVRPVELVKQSTNKPVGAALGAEKLPRLQIGRPELAQFLVEQVVSNAFVQKAPVVYA